MRQMYHPRHLPNTVAKLYSNICTQNNQEDLFLLTPLGPARLRMRTVLVTRMQLSRRSLARHGCRPTSDCMLGVEGSYSMSRASSSSISDDLEDDVDVDDCDDVDVRVSELTMHCSSSSIMRTSCEMSRACDALHCMRELVCRCIRRREAATRE